MEVFLLSALTVAVAEIGDRSLFLAILLGIRYRRPWPVFWGMALGLFANQLLSAFVGVWLFSALAAEWHPWIVAGVFLVMAVWVLIPEEEGASADRPGRGIVLSSAVAFFLLEMADKTQLAVIALAGGSAAIAPVVAGATLGILLVTTPALWLGHRFAAWLPLQTVRWVASALFALLALWLAFDAAGWLPEGGWIQPSRFFETLGR